MRCNPRPTRLARAAAPILAILALAACTGTFESRPPTLLVVAFEDTAPAVGLVRDTFSALEPGESRELAFVPGSRRGLPAPAVDVDVIDRAGARPTAVFLLRDPDTHEAHLQGFAIRDIDPGDPTAFAADPAATFLLANGGAAGDRGLLEALAPADYCPTAVEVSRTGRYAAVFEERSACGGAEFRAIYVLDLEAAAAGGEPVVVRAFDAPAPAGAGMVLDQEGGLDPDRRETLYWLDPVGLIEAYDVAADQVRTLDVGGMPSDVDGIRDLGRVLDLLILVDDDRYLWIDLRAETPAAEAVSSADGLTRLIEDPFGVTDEAVLLAENRLVVHADVREDAFELESFALERTDATLDPIDRFVYLLGDARIGVFDLLTFGEGGVSVATYSVPEIPSASVLTWTRARTEAP